MQAHGSPANILDMYASASIPETEVFGANEFHIPGYRLDPDLSNPETPDILVNRFASSAAHVAGHNLIIAESFTWLRNHFHTNLSHIKAESDQLFLNGINGIYYHGLCYSPMDADWPGWLFYASTQANFRNSIFRDIPVLNRYISRCQSVLQQGRADHDVLLYWPVYDLWMDGGPREIRFSVHNPKWLKESACGEAASLMVDRGYTFDYISDKQIRRTRVENGALVTEGNAIYRTLLVPAARYMKVNTLKHLAELANEGATILFWKHMPEEVPGWSHHQSRKEELISVLENMPVDSQVMLEDNLEKLLEIAKVSPESMVDVGLHFNRRKMKDHTIYFIANHSAGRVDGWVKLASSCRSALVMDPMTGHTGSARVRQTVDGPEIVLQMDPGETRILRVFEAEVPLTGPLPVLGSTGKTLELNGKWDIEFMEGGPHLPGKYQTDILESWTKFNLQHVQSFAGAARYTIEVSLPYLASNHYMLDLGDVRESARVWVNGNPAGVLVAHPFKLDISGLLEVGLNHIAIEVTNLSANRIRDLDIKGVDWKKFYDINLVNHLYEPFDASVWPMKPSGLLGPVKLIPMHITTL